MLCRCPPPVCIALLTLIQISIHIGYYLYSNKDFDRMQNLLLNSYLVYTPNKKSQLWRVFTYSFLHRSFLHLVPNMILQIVIGCTLELMPNSNGTVIIYFLGVVTGSLGVNLIDPSMCLLGSSGGIFALIMAYFAYFLMVKD